MHIVSQIIYLLVHFLNIQTSGALLSKLALPKYMLPIAYHHFTCPEILVEMVPLFNAPNKKPSYENPRKAFL